MTVINYLFYHVSPLNLAEGSIILPNYGRVISQIGCGHGSYGREMLLEYIRCKYYANKPSRFRSCFVCDSPEDINFYMQKNSPLGIIYQVEFLDNLALQHAACFNCLPPLPVRFGKTEEEVAHDYWKGEFVLTEGAPKCKEILAESGIRIIRHIGVKV